MKRALFILAFIFLALVVIFVALQQKYIYDHSLGYLAKNWQWEGNGAVRVKKPYEAFNNQTFIHWDAVHFQMIKDNAYNLEKSGGDYIFAFFPLFSWIWALLSLPPVGILFLNYLFFVLGTLLLLQTFHSTSNTQVLLLSLCLPGLVCFLIPYSEATFFLVLALAIWGYRKEKYWIYFIGMLLAAFTRPAATLLVPALCCVEFFYWIRHRNTTHALKSFLSKSLPLFLGTFIIGLYQLSYNSGSLFQFIHVQKSWDKKLSIPNNIGDWSDESYGINLALLSCVFVPLLVYLLMSLFSTPASKKTTGNSLEYLQLLSATFIIGTTLNILAFQHGNLHGLFRYVECTPFFYVLVFTFFDTVKKWGLAQRSFTLLSTFFITFLFFMIIPVSTGWNFSDTGFFLLFLFIGLWLFQDKKEYRLYQATLYSTMALNLLWTTYLFNMYLSNGWIYT